MAHDEARVAAAARQLAAEQARVRLVLDQLEGEAWASTLDEASRDRLLERGHFPEYGCELAWTPREVAGHLLDSARIFTGRIRALQAGPEPLLADFVTDDPVRLHTYRTRPLPAILADLDEAQRRLHVTVSGVVPGQLRQRGRHQVDGDIALGDVLAFLPGHQRDHADQVEALAEGARTRVS